MKDKDVNNFKGIGKNIFRYSHIPIPIWMRIVDFCYKHILGYNYIKIVFDRHLHNSHYRRHVRMISINKLYGKFN
jgi:hypothetical protein